MHRSVEHQKMTIPALLEFYKGMEELVGITRTNSARRSIVESNTPCCLLSLLPLWGAANTLQEGRTALSSEVEGRKMPLKICNDATRRRCGTET